MRIQYCGVLCDVYLQEYFCVWSYISIGIGVVTLQGFLIAFLGELFRISNSNSFGLVINLYRDGTMNLQTLYLKSDTTVNSIQTVSLSIKVFEIISDLF